MNRTLLIAGSAALLAGGLAWYFFSRTRKDSPQNSTPDEHSNQVAGEKKFRRTLRRSKQHSIVPG